MMNTSHRTSAHNQGPGKVDSMPMRSPPSLYEGPKHSHWHDLLRYTASNAEVPRDLICVWHGVT